MCGSCFLLRSATLCLLIEAFNPFTFKVIIDRYVVIIILLFVFFIFFFLKEVPLTFLIMLVWGDIG